MAKYIRPDELIQPLAEALGIDPKNTRRLIIDLKANEFAQVYVEQFGTTNLLELLTPIVEHGIVFKTGENKEQ